MIEQFWIQVRVDLAKVFNPAEFGQEELCTIDSKVDKSTYVCIVARLGVLMEVSVLGADDVLPYFIYLLLLSSPKHIHSNLRWDHCGLVGSSGVVGHDHVIDHTLVL